VTTATTTRTPDEITNSQDIIDSRDVIARIEYLEGELLNEDGELDTDTEDEDYRDMAAELRNLQELQSEAEGYTSDWQYGSTLIRDSYFTEYTEDLCKDIGDVPREIPWYIEINWEATAEHIKQDYTLVDFDGVEYWVR
jgi:hypothetical protein